MGESNTERDAVAAMAQRITGWAAPTVVYALPGPTLVGGNPAFRARLADDAALERRPDWTRLRAALIQVGRTGAPAEMRTDDDGLAVHMAPVVGDAGAVRAVVAWIDAAAEASRCHRVLSAASHDLRQPFQAMRFFHSVLDSQMRETKPRQTLSLMGRALASGERLLDGLIDITRLDTGTVAVQRRPVAVAGLLDGLMHEFQPQAAARRLKLHARPIEAEVDTDPALVERLLRQLLSNALRFTERGGVLVGARRRGEQVRVEVWDTGPGIASDRLDTIFNDFAQYSPGPGGGPGLGLGIVRRLARLLDASVTVRSKPGAGSVFAVSLPAARAPAREAPAPTLEGATVLVVDDDPMVLTALDLMLASWGIRVLAAADMDDALTRLGQAEPDLVLADLRLRGCSGFEVVDRVRSRLRRQVPALMLTGETGGDEAVEGQRRGIAFLHKPIQGGPLKEAIAGAMRGAGP
jgi:signal transduction histidine kinase/CheY-like chemotaxis protein